MNQFNLQVTNDRGTIYPQDQQGYVTVQEDSHIGVKVTNNSPHDSSVEIRLNSDLMGEWVLSPYQSAVIYNPDPKINTGLFKAVRKGSADWQAGGMDQVSKDDQGVVTATFQQGYIKRDTTPTVLFNNTSFTSRGGDVERSFDLESYSPTLDSFEPTRGGSRGVSADTHENAGIVLEGKNRQQFDRVEFIKAKTPPETIELRLVLTKESSIPPIRSTRQRPPSL